MYALRSLIQIFSVLTFAVFATGASAQQRPSYGQDVNLANAGKVAHAALAEAQKNSWNVAIAIVDNHGTLVYYERMDDTQSASPVIDDRESTKRRDVPSPDSRYGRYGQQRSSIVFGHTRRHADYRRAAHHGGR